MSRADFGIHLDGDTGRATLQIYDLTPDTEYVWFGFLHGTDIKLADTLHSTLVLKPGDTVRLPVIYQAKNALPIVRDTLKLTVMLVKNGVGVEEAKTFFTPVIGRCYSTTVECDRSDLGTTGALDSLCGRVVIKNQSDDSESVTLTVRPLIASTMWSDRPVDWLAPRDSVVVHVTLLPEPVNRSVVDSIFVSSSFQSDTLVRVLPPLAVRGASTVPTFDFRVHEYWDTVMVGSQLSRRTLVKNLEGHIVTLTDSLVTPTPEITTPDINPFMVGFSTVASVVFAPVRVGSHRAVYCLTDRRPDYVHTDSIVFHFTAVPSSGVSGSEPSGGSMVVSLYPNPTQGSMRLIGLAPEARFEIADAVGRLVYRSELGTEDWDGRFADGTMCPSGIYWCTVLSGTRRETHGIELRR